MNTAIVTSSSIAPSFSNRGFLYGDAVFETLKMVNGQILFWEDHYFRLMAAMRIVRMEIPNHFTLENLEAEMQQVVTQNQITSGAVRIRLTVYRESEGLYTPKTNEVGYVIQASSLENKTYVNHDKPYEIELYKDFFIPAQLTSTIKTTNKITNVMAGVFAKENDYDNCILLNEHKNVVEAINANVFIVKEGILLTPPLSEGCVKGIFRKQVLEAAKLLEIPTQELPITSFDLQKSTEVFLTNIISGIQSVTQYRKQTYGREAANQILDLINRKNKLV